MPTVQSPSETIQFFDKYGYPFELIKVRVSTVQARGARGIDELADSPQGVHRRAGLYGDTDVLDPMAAKGEIEPLLKKHSESRPTGGNSSRPYLRGHPDLAFARSKPQTSLQSDSNSTRFAVAHKEQQSRAACPALSVDGGGVPPVSLLLWFLPAAGEGER